MATDQRPVRPRQVAAYQSLRPVTVDEAATCGAQIGVNLLLPDGTLGTLGKLKALFGASGAANSGGAVIDTTDDLEEGQYHFWFTDRRAQDAVGALLADTVTISLTYVADTSLTATLKDLADSGAGAALLKITRDSKGRISGTSAATTSDLTEGANLYYTDARADARITAQKGLANGLAPLGGDGKISTGYLPAAVLGQVSYQGTWDASAGTPPTAAPEKGWYFIVTVAGTTDLDGIAEWDVGDWAIYDGTAWAKVDNTDAVAMVNGKTGNVTLTAADVGAATTAQGALADTALQPGANVSTLTNDSGFITDAPSDGQQYARKDGGWVVVTSGGGGSGDVVGPSSATDGDVALFDGTTGKLLKSAGSSFAALVRAAVLTGLSTATSAVIAATDTVLQALGKLQAQITDNRLPSDFITGAQLVWVSATAITVKIGAFGVENTGKVLRLSADIAKTGLSLSASTLYYVYGYNNAGTPDVEFSTTAPASPYSGTARSKTGDSSRRFLGAVLTDSSGNIVSFSHAWQQGRVDYRTAVGAAPFKVLGNGRSTAGAIISMAAVTPVGASHAVVFLFNDASTAQTVLVSASDGATVSTGDYEGFVAAGAQLSGALRMDGNRAMSYAYQAAPSGAAGFTVRVTGYLFGR